MGHPPPPSVSRCAPHSRSPVSLIVLTRSFLLAQVGTLSFSHPLFGVSVLFILFMSSSHRRFPCLFAFFLSDQHRYTKERIRLPWPAWRPFRFRPAGSTCRHLLITTVHAPRPPRRAGWVAGFPAECVTRLTLCSVARNTTQRSASRG